MPDLTGKTLADRPVAGSFCLKCINCKFWNSLDGTDKLAPTKGECRRSAPRSVDGVWTVIETPAGYWCGEGS